MDINENQLLGQAGYQTIDRGREIYVFLSRDKTHLMPDPSHMGHAWFTQDIAAAKVVDISLRKEFKAGGAYTLLTLKEALPILCNTQAELSKAWEPVIAEMEKSKKPMERLEIYAKYRKKWGAHPLLEDKKIKLLLGIVE